MISAGVEAHVGLREDPVLGQVVVQVPPEAARRGQLSSHSPSPGTTWDQARALTVHEIQDEAELVRCVEGV